MQTKLGIVLATYNEVQNLPRLVDSLEALVPPGGTHIFVVDDTSPDGTSDVARALASRYGNISLITRPGKLGLGTALRDGIRAALELGCHYVLTMDADLSHRPGDVPALVAEAEGGIADLVQGSRYAPGGHNVGMGPRRRLQSYLANRLFRTLLGCPREVTTNFRVHTRRSAQLVVEKGRGRDYEFQPECVLIAMAHGLRISEVPITFNARAGGRSKLGMAQTLRWGWFLGLAAVAFKLRLGRFSR